MVLCVRMSASRCQPLTRKPCAAGRASASEFEGLTAALAGAPAACVRHASLLQYGRAAAAAAQGAPAAAHWETMQREERQMALAASEGARGVRVLQTRRHTLSAQLQAAGPDNRVFVLFAVDDRIEPAQLHLLRGSHHAGV